MTKSREAQLQIQRYRETELVYCCRRYQDEGDYYYCTEPSSSCQPPRSLLSSAARKDIIEYCFRMAKSCELATETPYIGLNYLDRFLDSPQGFGWLTSPQDSNGDGHKDGGGSLTLVYLSCMGMAVQQHDHVTIDPETIVCLGRGKFTSGHVQYMEQLITEALGADQLDPPTVVTFCKLYMDLLPPRLMTDASKERLLAYAQQQAREIIEKVTELWQRPSQLSLKVVHRFVQARYSENKASTIEDFLNSAIRRAEQRAALLEQAQKNNSQNENETPTGSPVSPRRRVTHHQGGKGCAAGIDMSPRRHSSAALSYSPKSTTPTAVSLRRPSSDGKLEQPQPPRLSDTTMLTRKPSQRRLALHQQSNRRQQMCRTASTGRLSKRSLSPQPRASDATTMLSRKPSERRLGLHQQNNRRHQMSRTQSTGRLSKRSLSPHRTTRRQRVPSAGGVTASVQGLLDMSLTKLVAPNLTDSSTNLSTAMGGDHSEVSTGTRRTSPNSCVMGAWELTAGV